MKRMKLSIRDLDLTDKRVLIRVDFNVPLSADGTGTSRITDDTRIRETLPTIEYALRHRAKVILCSHLGRPKGKFVAGMSLRSVVDHLRLLLDHILDPDENVAFSPDCVGEIASELATNLESGQTLLLENLRFHAEEEANDPDFAQQLASLCDLYVNDAFGSAHRAHASTEGVTHFVSQSAAGLLMEKELTYMGKALGDSSSPTGSGPDRPFVAIIGGAKVSDKIGVIDHLLEKADAILIGGGMAYTFLNAQGQATGKSLVETDKLSTAKAALDKAKANGVRFLLPIDHVLADKFALDATTQVFSGSGPFPAELMALDIGPASVELFAKGDCGSPHRNLERPHGCLRDACFRSRNKCDCRGSRLEHRGYDHRGRRRFGLCHSQIGLRGQDHAYLYRRRCQPGIPRRQNPAGSRRLVRTTAVAVTVSPQPPRFAPP